MLNRQTRACWKAYAAAGVRVGIRSYLVMPREAAPAAGMAELRPEEVALALFRQQRQLVARVAGTFEVSGGDHDRRQRRQQCGLRRPFRRFVARTRDGRCRRAATSLGEPQEGESGLRLQPEPARLAVCGFGLVELAAQPAHLAPEIAGARSRAAVGAQFRATLGGDSRLERVVPVAMQLQHAGAMSKTAAGERDQILLLLAPRSERLGPLTCPAQLERLLARKHDAAVDDPRSDRRQL